MKNINKLLLLLSLIFITLHAEDLVENNATVVEQSDEVVVEQTDQPSEQEPAVDLVTTEDTEDYFDDGADNNVESTTDANTSVEVQEQVRNMNAFEKLFVNHSAYRYYAKGVQELYKNNYKEAYDNAMKAKAIIDNTQAKGEQVIALPYMPNYVRETGYTPKRIYYKTVKAKPYELRKLIVKAKLISPPIASVIIKKTSTYMDVIVKNYGDLPLDEFELLINDESIVIYDKILPNEQKITKVDIKEEFYEISFKEKYGFAPKSIMLSEGE